MFTRICVCEYRDIVVATNFLNHSIQLDIRTKLCIRDSLYRLARSAEQRHNCANLNENISEDKFIRVASSIDQDANRQVLAVYSPYCIFSLFTI